jgi:hypothetical protein
MRSSSSGPPIHTFVAVNDLFNLVHCDLWVFVSSLLQLMIMVSFIVLHLLESHGTNK